MSNEIQVKMDHSKSTKGTERFDSVSPKDKKLITCLYINKEAFVEFVPKSITVIVQAHDPS